MDDALSEKLAEIEASFDELEKSLGDPEVLSDPSQLADIGKRHADLRDVVADIRRWRQAHADLEVAREMADDPDMATMAKDLEAEVDKLEESIKRVTRSQRPQRCQRRDRRDSLRSRRRRGIHLGRRSAAHVPAVCRIEGVPDRGHGSFGVRNRRIRQGDRFGEGARAPFPS